MCRLMLCPDTNKQPSPARKKEKLKKKKKPRHPPGILQTNVPESVFPLSLPSTPLEKHFLLQNASFQVACKYACF